MGLAQAIRTAPTVDAAADLAAEWAEGLFAIAEGSQGAAVALARQSRAAEISAGLRRLAKQAQPVTAEAWESVATAIDNGRL